MFQFPESPLSKKGEQQADFIAQRCLDLEADIVLSSTMKRAYQTAEKIATIKKLGLVEYECLKEILRPTSLRGVSKTDPKVIEYEELIKEKWKDKDWYLGGEENFHDVTTRAKTALETIEAREEEKIIVATHGYFLRTMLAEMVFGHENYDYKTLLALQNSFKTSHTGLTYCTVQNGKWIVMTWNDFAHLGDERVI